MRLQSLSSLYDLTSASPETRSPGPVSKGLKKVSEDELLLTRLEMVTEEFLKSLKLLLTLGDLQPSG